MSSIYSYIFLFCPLYQEDIMQNPDSLEYLYPQADSSHEDTYAHTLLLDMNFIILSTLLALYSTGEEPLSHNTQKRIGI